MATMVPLKLTEITQGKSISRNIIFLQQQDLREFHTFITGRIQCHHLISLACFGHLIYFTLYLRVTYFILYIWQDLYPLYINSDM